MTFVLFCVMIIERRTVFKSLLRKSLMEEIALRKLQEPNYKLMISTDSYTGNFERELISYVFGILDSVQMEIAYSQEYRDVFYKEENMTEEQCYAFLEEYLFERHQNVDDWEQMTFYEICSYKEYGHCTSIAVFLDKPLDNEWEKRFLRRIQEFFGGAYKEIEDVVWQRQFGHDSNLKKLPELLNIELIKNKKVIKTLFE